MPNLDNNTKAGATAVVNELRQLMKTVERIRKERDDMEKHLKDTTKTDMSTYSFDFY
jgi:uncharacterized protein (UPF0335 family)